MDYGERSTIPGSKFKLQRLWILIFKMFQTTSNKNFKETGEGTIEEIVVWKLAWMACNRCNADLNKKQFFGRFYCFFVFTVFVLLMQRTMWWFLLIGDDNEMTSRDLTAVKGFYDREKWLDIRLFDARVSVQLMDIEFESKRMKYAKKEIRTELRASKDSLALSSSWLSSFVHSILNSIFVVDVVALVLMKSPCFGHTDCFVETHIFCHLNCYHSGRRYASKISTIHTPVECAAWEEESEHGCDYFHFFFETDCDLDCKNKHKIGPYMGFRINEWHLAITQNYHKYSTLWCLTSTYIRPSRPLPSLQYHWSFWLYNFEFI